MSSVHLMPLWEGQELMEGIANVRDQTDRISVHRCQIVAECATNHGGNLKLAEQMIVEAAASGADIVKFQAYETNLLRPSDPQYDWLKRCELSDEQLELLRDLCEENDVKMMVSLFGRGRTIPNGILTKRGHGDSHIGHADFKTKAWVNVIPLYPAPLEAVAAVKWDGGYWSDHSVGLDVAKYFVARGARFVEKHFSLTGKGRNQPWDMTPTNLKELRRWTGQVATMTLGTPHSERWTTRIV